MWVCTRRLRVRTREMVSILLAHFGQHALRFGQSRVTAAVPQLDFADVFLVIESVKSIDQAVNLFLFVEVIGVARVGLLIFDD